MLAVLERLDVAEQVSDSLYQSAVGRACIRSFFKLLKKLSAEVLSQQLPLRLIEQTTQYAFNRAWKAWLAYWLPQSE